MGERMIKVKYRLMAAGIKNHINIWGKTFKLDPIWHVPLYSKERYVVAKDEEYAYHIIRGELKAKYEGFRIMGIETIE